ncbi:MAG TPA: hypothetical protein ENI23_07155 [bacterium]|nr:hypothetical protein [bacterium]
MPTIPKPHAILSETYNEFFKSGELSKTAIKQLEKAFEVITEGGNTATVRPAIYAPKHPNLDFIKNSINISTFDKYIQDLTDRYRQVKDEVDTLENIQVTVLSARFYSSTKVGVMHTEDGKGNAYIEMAFGEHADIISRGEVDPDKYTINKKNKEITTREIAHKEFTYVQDEKGVKKVKLSKEEAIKPVLSDEELETFLDYALKLEKKCNPQECEIARLDDGTLIIQDMRDLEGFLHDATDSEVINFQEEIRGVILEVKNEKDLTKKGDIVITANLDVNLVTQIALVRKPEAVIFTKGSLTAHSVTILRELGVPLLIDHKLNFKSGDKVKITRDGKVTKQ